METWIRNSGILIPQSSNLKEKAKASSSSPTKSEDDRGSDVAKKSKKKKKLDSVAMWGLSDFNKFLFCILVWSSQVGILFICLITA